MSPPSSKTSKCKECGNEYPSYYVQSNGICMDCHVPPRNRRGIAPGKIFGSYTGTSTAKGRFMAQRVLEDDQ